MSQASTLGNNALHAALNAVLTLICMLVHCCRAAKATGVAMTTADSESELRKIAVLYPTAQVLLRIRQDDPSARCQLGNKYGAEADEIAGTLPFGSVHLCNAR